MNDMKETPSVWKPYLEKNHHKIQEFDSGSTARSQVPRSKDIILEAVGLKATNKVVLDIGCGKFNQKNQEALTKLGFNYYGIDPFNKAYRDNINSILKTMEGQSDIVSLNNVLNTIKEKDIWKAILMQAKNAMNPDTGKLIIIIYEGIPTSKEKSEGLKVKDLLPVETRDGWQHRMPIESYLSAVQKVFPCAKIVRHSKKGKYIIADFN